MTPLVDLARRAMAAWDGRLELDLFGTEDPEEISTQLVAFTRELLAEPVDALFYTPGVGLVVGLRLSDGRDVVIKVHRWNADVDRLAATQEVQTHLADRALPVPRPVLAPTPLGTGIATVEEHRPGRRLDGRTPEARRTMATGLYDLIDATHGLQADVGRALVLRPTGAPLYPEPHSVRFDFDATAEGAEWIDDLATKARQRLDAVDLEDRIGHLDWRVQNLAFGAHDEIVGIYDSDSFGKAPEPVIVGCAAGGFCIDWDAGAPDPPPTVDEVRAFVADYESARGRPFTEEEREAADAANLAMVAYGARSQHSDLTLQPDFGDTSQIGWFRLLRDRGERCL